MLDRELVKKFVGEGVKASWEFFQNFPVFFAFLVIKLLRQGLSKSLLWGFDCWEAFFGPNILGPKKILCPKKICVQKNFVSKKIFLSKKKFVSQNFFVQNNFGLKKI